MAQAMERALTDDAFRELLLASSVQQSEKYCWERSAKLAISAFEQAAEQRAADRVLAAQSEIKASSGLSLDLRDGLRQITLEPPSQQDLVYCAQAIAENHPIRSVPRLYLDISILIREDAMTGIQRVVRSLVAEFINKPIQGFDVELIYRDAHGNFRAAKPLLPMVMGDSDPSIDVIAGDIYLALDLDLDGILVEPRNDFIQYQRQRGLKVYYLVYDLLPVLQSDHFHSGIRERFPLWLDYIDSQADGLICISRAVADELKQWLQHNCPQRLSPLQLGYFHLGADIEASMPTSGLPDNAEAILREMRERPSILVVGTIEPRKGQQQVLDALELLWDQGHDVNLVLVGKSGWEMEAFEKRLDRHPRRDKNLFWLRGISDEMLQKVYGASALLLSASTGEGFGLPLIEAAQHGLPILARDIPVFREVAADHAMYFTGDAASDLAPVIAHWLKLHQAGEVPQSTAMGWLSWAQSAAQLRQLVMGQREWYTSLQPDTGAAA
jgi:glycosyltransferase involved in cell wall biosynthesis